MRNTCSRRPNSFKAQRFAAGLARAVDILPAAEGNAVDFQTMPGSASTMVTVENDQGEPITFTLSGRGAAHLVPVGDAFDLTLTSTDGRWALTVSADPRAGCRFSSIRVEGSIGKLTAANADLVGSIDVTGGLRSLRLRDVTGPRSRERGAAGRPLSAPIENVAELSVQSATRIASLRAAQWLDADGVADVITTPHRRGPIAGDSART